MNDQDKHNLADAVKAAEGSYSLAEKMGCAIQCLPFGPKRRSVRFVTCNTDEPAELHAELHAIAEAAAEGWPVTSAAVYLTHSPCLSCAQMLWACRIGAVYYLKLGDEKGCAWLKDMGVETQHVHLNKL